MSTTKDPGHFSEHESDSPPAEPERKMTPYAPFDSRPKLTVAKASDPVDPFAGIPRMFPRDPRSPSEFERQRIERASRDTEPTGLGDEDKTPADRPFEIRVERELRELRGDVEAIKATIHKTEQRSIDTYELVKEIDKRQRAYDVERKWLPVAAWAVNFVLVCWALLRTYR